LHGVIATHKTTILFLFFSFWSTIASPSSSISGVTFNTPITPKVSNLLMSINVRHNSSNYLVWKSQVLLYFKGQDVFGYLNSIISPLPSKPIISSPTDNIITTTHNPLYDQWLRQDSLILATINSSLTKDVITKVLSYTTSRKVWLALKRSFSFFSCAKTIQVHIQLANTKKGVMSAYFYFLHIKRLLDELALAGQPLTCDDIFT